MDCILVVECDCEIHDICVLRIHVRLVSVSVYACIMVGGEGDVNV